MKKAFVFLAIALLLSSTIVAAGFWDSITGAFSLKSLKLPFFGKKDLTEKPQVNIELPESIKMGVGDTVERCGKTVTLLGASSSGVVMEVGGVQGTVPPGITTLVNGVEVTTVLILSAADSANSMAILKLNCEESAPVEEVEEVEAALDCDEVYLPADFYSGLLPEELSTGAGSIQNSGKSGKQFCKEQGYDGCAAINRVYERHFYNSKSSKCAGLAFANINTRATNCAEPLQKVQGNCATGIYLLGESKEMDIKDYNTDESVICCSLS